MPRAKSSDQHRENILDVFNLVFPMLDKWQKQTTEAKKAYDILVEYTSIDYMTKLTGLIPGAYGRLLPMHRSIPVRQRRKTAPSKPRELVAPAAKRLTRRKDSK